MLADHAACCCAGGDPADIADKQARYDAAVAARDSITAVLDYSKQPSFEVGTMGFWIATGEHPCGDAYPMCLHATTLRHALEHRRRTLRRTVS
jgi:hypothetical protein